MAASLRDLQRSLDEAVAHHQAGRLAEAGRLYQMVVDAQPRATPALHLLGVVAYQRGQPERALPLIDKAITLNPNHADFHNNRGLVLVALGRIDEAIAAYRTAIALDSAYIDAHNNLGVALSRLGRWEEAGACYRTALAGNPSLAAGHLNLGNYYRECGRLDDAIASYQRSVELNGANAGARVLLMTALWEATRWEDARAQLDRLAPLLAPDTPTQRGQALDYSTGAALAFFLPYIVEDHPLHDVVLRGQAQSFAAAAPYLPPLPRLGRGERRLRVGYLSPDFGDHAIAHVVRPIFAQHDRDRFEVSCFSLLDRSHNPGPYLGDIRDAADHFIDLSRVSDAVAASRIREREIDILVDLSGYMRGGRPRIVAARPAPIQVYWLGHGGGLGATHIDYIIGDPAVTPAAEDHRYVEKVCRLPDIFCPADRHSISATAPNRTECGLPATGLVFCAFNNPTKISPEVFAIWMRLLAGVPGSSLWLTGSRNDAAFRQRAAAHGIDAERLIFARRVENKAVHLARHRLADLFLDTFTFNAATTALDALWAGLPMVSRIGTSFYSRIGASALRAIGLDELVCADAETYERRALQLALDPAALLALRQRLDQRRLTAPIFDAARFVRHLEAAFGAMWRRHTAGQPPASFDVAVIEA